MVTDGASLVRSILAKSELELRRDGLRARLLSLPIDTAAAELESVCTQADCSSPDAREALVTVAMVLVEVGESCWLAELRNASTALHLLSLQRLLRQYQSEAVPSPSEMLVPDYGQGRELTVGERRSLARRPNRRHIDRLLRDPHPQVIAQLLQNPKLVENDVIRLATQRPLSASTARALACASHWLVRGRVRMALIHNPWSPCHLIMPLLALCTRSELDEIVQSPSLHLAVRATAQEAILRRPPSGALTSHTLQ